MKALKTNRIAKPNFPIIFIYIAFYITLNFLSIHFFYTDTFYYQALGGQLDISRIDSFIAIQKKLGAISHFMVPFFLCIRLGLTTFCLYVISYIDELELSWRECLEIILIGELAFVIMAVVRFLYLLINPPTSFQDLSWISSLSLSTFFRNAPRYTSYLLQTINIFELSFWIIITFRISRTTKLNILQSFGTVAKSYGLGLLLWVVSITFLIIQYS
jgi:hypothetical protein